MLATPGVATPAVVPKSVSTGPRFAFFAGVEGSGHHFFHTLLLQLLGQPAPIFVRFQTNLSKHLYDDKIGSRGVFSALEPTHVRTAASKFVAELSATRERESVNSILVPLNGLTIGINSDGTPSTAEKLSRHFSWCWGMMSYPNYNGGNKQTQRPDVRVLADLVDGRASADLRIVLLLRNPVYANKRRPAYILIKPCHHAALG